MRTSFNWPLMQVQPTFPRERSTWLSARTLPRTAPAGNGYQGFFGRIEFDENNILIDGSVCEYKTHLYNVKSYHQKYVTLL